MRITQTHVFEEDSEAVDDRGVCVGILAVADVALHTGKTWPDTLSEPTSSASSASAGVRCRFLERATHQQHRAMKED